MSKFERCLGYMPFCNVCGCDDYECVQIQLYNGKHITICGECLQLALEKV